jgi:uncharacterized membrane protein
MIGIFFHVWFQLVFVFCFIALLGGGIPAVVTLFWPNVFLCGILGFFSTSIAIDRIGREASEQLQKK